MILPAERYLSPGPSIAVPVDRKGWEFTQGRHSFARVQSLKGNNLYLKAVGIRFRVSCSVCHHSPIATADSALLRSTAVWSESNLRPIKWQPGTLMH